jgi:flagella basal body P-ring formation protein FlgA
MTDAAASQRLRVQNLDSLKVVEGVAESDGVVRVSP